MAGKMEQLNQSVVIRSLRRFRDRYFPNTGKVVGVDLTTVVDTGERQQGFLDLLPVSQIIQGNVFHLSNCLKLLQRNAMFNVCVAFIYVILRSGNVRLKLRIHVAIYAKHWNKYNNGLVTLHKVKEAG